MGAAGFGTLASHFPDRTIITYDPRGRERSIKPDDRRRRPRPEEHADDLHRIIQEVGGPVDMFASSGGATNALALVAKHPEDVRTLVAHEPPMAAVLPDRENGAGGRAARSTKRTAQRLRRRDGALHRRRQPPGRVPRRLRSAAGPDPAMFGMPTEDDGSRTDPLLGLDMVGSMPYEPDLDALRSASTRIVIAAGVEQRAHANRCAYVVAEQLGTKVVVFPSGHGGFLGGEYGQPPVSPRRSRRSCARCSRRPDGRPSFRNGPSRRSPLSLARAARLCPGRRSSTLPPS